MEQVNITKVIREITPLYNLYKKSNREISGTEALVIMWGIGDILKKAIEISGVPPHNLYRKIYGKSEGSVNIVQNSYITREFLGRAYRIRSMFKDLNEVKRILPSLSSFILFREAMPFFDNKNYKLIGKEREDLLRLLNSSQKNTVIMRRIKELQAKKIGIKNPRNQKLNELEGEKQVFITFYNYLYNLIKNSTDYKSFQKDAVITDSLLSRLSAVTSCLAQEGLLSPDIPQEGFSDQSIAYVGLLRRLIVQKDPKERRRFRRLIQPTRIIKLAEMLQGVSSEGSFDRYKTSLIK